MYAIFRILVIFNVSIKWRPQIRQYGHPVAPALAHGVPQQFLSTFEKINIFQHKKNFHRKMKNLIILLKIIRFSKKLNFIDLGSPNKKSIDGPIIHAISYTYTLVDVYQGFFNSHRCLEIWSLISQWPHSKNLDFTPPKHDFFRKVQSRISNMRGAREL